MLVKIPPQHSAWVFLLVPVAMAGCLGAATWAGLIFAVTWLAAYPATYFGARGVMNRLREGHWSPTARSDATAAVPWAIVTVGGMLVLLFLRPWVLIPGIAVLIVWCLSMWLMWIRRERSIANEFLMVVLATFSIPLMWGVAVNSRYLADIPASLWTAMLASALFFVGAVIHVESLLVRTDARRWRYASLIFHALALVGMTLFSWRFAFPFGLALIRAIVAKPGAKPSHLGLMEAVVAASLVVATVFAVQ